MASNKKIEIIQKTYEMLKEKSPDEIKIRDIAKECSCTPTAIYKHFEDLEDLIRYGCVRFLENYIWSTMQIVNEDMDPMEMLIVMWDEFSKSAFKNIDVFLHMFWGKYADKLGDTIFDYYYVFPERWKNMGGLLTSTFFNSDIKERNFMIVRRAATLGYFPNEKARLISDMQCFLIHGVLMDYKDIYREEKKAEEGYQYFMTILRSHIESYRIR